MLCGGLLLLIHIARCLWDTSQELWAYPSMQIVGTADRQHALMKIMHFMLRQDMGMQCQSMAVPRPHLSTGTRALQGQGTFSCGVVQFAVNLSCCLCLKVLWRCIEEGTAGGREWALSFMFTCSLEDDAYLHITHIFDADSIGKLAAEQEARPRCCTAQKY